MQQNQLQKHLNVAECSESQYNGDWRNDLQFQNNSSDNNSHQLLQNNRYLNFNNINFAEEEAAQSLIENINGGQPLSDEIIKDFGDLQDYSNEPGVHYNNDENGLDLEKSQNQFSYEGDYNRTSFQNQQFCLNNSENNQSIQMKEESNHYQDPHQLYSLPYKKEDSYQNQVQNYNHQRIQSSQMSNQYVQENQEFQGTIGPSSFIQDEFCAEPQPYLQQNQIVQSSRMTSITKLDQNQINPHSEKNNFFNESDQQVEKQQQMLKMKEDQLESRYKELRQFAISNLGYHMKQSNPESQNQLNAIQQSHRVLGEFSDDVIIDDDTILKSNDNFSAHNSKYSKIQLKQLHPPQSEKHGKNRLKQNKMYSDNGDIRQEQSPREFTDNYTLKTQNISGNDQIIWKNIQRGQSQYQNQENNCENGNEKTQNFENLNSSVKTDIEQGDPIICYSQTKGGPRDLEKEEVFFNIYNKQNNAQSYTQSQTSKAANLFYDLRLSPQKIFQENDEDNKNNLRSSFLNQNSEDDYKQNQNTQDLRNQTISSQQSVNTQQKNLTIKLFIKAQNAKNEMQNRMQREADETPLFPAVQNNNSSEKQLLQPEQINQLNIYDAYESMTNLIPSQNQEDKVKMIQQAKDFTLNYNSMNSQKQNNFVLQSEILEAKQNNTSFFNGQNYNNTSHSNALQQRSMERNPVNYNLNMNLSSKFGQRVMSSSSNNSANKVAQYVQSQIKNTSNSLERRQDNQSESIFNAAKSILLKQDKPYDIFKTQGVQQHLQNNLQLGKSDKDYYDLRFGVQYGVNSNNTRESKEHQFSSRAAVIPQTITDRDRPITYQTQMTQEGAIASPNYLNNDNNYSWRADKIYVYDKPISTEGYSQDRQNQLQVQRDDLEKQQNFKDSQTIKQYLFKNKGQRESHSIEGNSLKQPEQRINYRLQSPTANSLCFNNCVRNSSLQKQRFEELHNSGLALLKKTSALIKNPNAQVSNYRNNIKQNEEMMHESQDNSRQKDFARHVQVQQQYPQQPDKSSQNNTVVNRKKFILRMFQKNLGQQPNDFKQSTSLQRNHNELKKSNYLEYNHRVQPTEEYQHSYQQDIDRLFQKERNNQLLANYNSKEGFNQRSVSLDEIQTESKNQLFVEKPSICLKNERDRQQLQYTSSNEKIHVRKKSIADEKIEKLKIAASQLYKENKIISNTTSNFKEINEYPPLGIGKGLQTQLTSIDSKGSQCNSKIKRLKQFEKEQQQEKQRLQEIGNNQIVYQNQEQKFYLQRNDSDYQNPGSLSAQQSKYLENQRLPNKFEEQFQIKQKEQYILSNNKPVKYFTDAYQNNYKSVQEPCSQHIMQDHERQQSLERQLNRLKQIEELEQKNKILDDKVKQQSNKYKAEDNSHQQKKVSSPNTRTKRYEQYQDPQVYAQNSSGLHQTLDSHKNSNFTLGNKKYRRQGNHSQQNTSSSNSKESYKLNNDLGRIPVYKYQKSSIEMPNQELPQPQNIQQKGRAANQSTNFFSLRGEHSDYYASKVNKIQSNSRNEQDNYLVNTIKSQKDYQINIRDAPIPENIHNISKNIGRQASENRNQNEYHSNYSNLRFSQSQVQNKPTGISREPNADLPRTYFNQNQPLSNISQLKERSSGSNISRPDMLPCKGPPVKHEQFNDQSNQFDRRKENENLMFSQTYGNQLNFSNYSNQYQQTNLLSSIQFSDNIVQNSHQKFIAKQDDNSINLQESDMLARYLHLKETQQQLNKNMKEISSLNRSQLQQNADSHKETAGKQFIDIKADARKIEDYKHDSISHQKRDLSPVTLAAMELKSSFGQKQVLYAKIDHKQSNNKKHLFEIQEQSLQNEFLINQLEQTLIQRQSNEQLLNSQFLQNTNQNQKNDNYLMQSEQTINDQSQDQFLYMEENQKQQSVKSKKYISSAECKEPISYPISNRQVSQFQQNQQISKNQNDTINQNCQQTQNQVNMNSSFKSTVPFLFGGSQLQKAIYGGQFSNSQQIFLENASEYFKLMLMAQLKQNQLTSSNQNSQKINIQEQQQMFEKYSDSQISQSIEQIINQSKQFLFGEDSKHIDEEFTTEKSKQSVISQQQVDLLEPQSILIQQNQKCSSVQSLRDKSSNQNRSQNEQKVSDKKQSRSSLKSNKQSQYQNQLLSQNSKAQNKSSKSLKVNNHRGMDKRDQSKNSLNELQQMWDKINPNKSEFDVKNLINMQFKQAQMLMDLQQELQKVKQIEESHDNSLDKQSSKLQIQQSIENMQSSECKHDQQDSVFESQSQRPPKPNENKKDIQDCQTNQLTDPQILNIKNSSSFSQANLQSNQIKNLKSGLNQEGENPLKLKTPLIENSTNPQNPVFSKRSDYSAKSKLSQTCLSNLSQQKASTLSLIKKIYQQMEKIDQHIASKEKIDMERYSKMERRMNRLFQKYSKIKEQNLIIEQQAEQEALASQSITRSDLQYDHFNENQFNNIDEVSQNKSSSANDLKHSKKKYSHQQKSKEEPKLCKLKINNFEKDQQKDIEKIEIAIIGAESTLYSQNFVEMDLRNNLLEQKNKYQIEMIKPKHTNQKSTNSQIQILEYQLNEKQREDNHQKIDFNNQFPSLNQSYKRTEKQKELTEKESEYGSTSSLQNRIEQTASNLLASNKSNTYADISQCGSVIEGQLKINPGSDNSIVNYFKNNDFGDKQIKTVHQQTQNINQFQYEKQALQNSLNNEKFTFQKQQFMNRSLQNEEQLYYQNQENKKQNDANQMKQSIVQQQQYAANQNEILKNQQFNCQNNSGYPQIRNSVYSQNTPQQFENNEQVSICQNQQQIQPLTTNQIELESQVNQLNNAIEILRNEHLNQINQMKEFYTESLKQIREEVHVVAAKKSQKEETSDRKPKREDNNANTPVNYQKINTKSQENLLNLTNLTMSASEQQNQRKLDTHIASNRRTNDSHKQPSNHSNKPANQKVYLQDKQQSIINQHVSTNESQANLKSQQLDSNEERNKQELIQSKVQKQAQEAIQKLMDQRKFTDTIEQLNQAVQQKEQLESKLQRIKEKIQMAKSIKQKQMNPYEIHKNKNSNQSYQKSRYDQCADSADVRTSDIYQLIKQNDHEFSEDQTQSILSGSYRQGQLQANPKTEKATCRHNSSQNLLIIQNDNLHQPQKSFQTVNPSPFNDNMIQQSKAQLDYSYILNNDQNISIYQDDQQLQTYKNNSIQKTEISECERQNQTQQQQLKNKLEKTSVFSGDFGMSNNHIQHSEHKNQSATQSFEAIANQQSIPQLMKHDNSQIQYSLQNKNTEQIDNQNFQARPQDQFQLQEQQNHQASISMQNSMIKIDQKHSAYQQFVIANSGQLESTLLNQNSEQSQSKNVQNIQNNQNAYIHPFSDATFSNTSSVYLNSKNQVLSQSQQNISFQGTQNQHQFKVQNDQQNSEQNINIFNQQKSSFNNLNVQQINQNLKTTSLNEKFAKPFVPSQIMSQNNNFGIQELQSQVLQKEKLDLSYNKVSDDKILDIYLENHTLQNDSNNQTNQGYIESEKVIMNDNRRGIYQKIVDLQQLQNNRQQLKQHTFLNGHLNTEVPTVTSSQANIQQNPQINNNSFQNSINNTQINYEYPFVNSQQKNLAESRNFIFQNKLNQMQNCNPLRKSPLRSFQGMGSGLGVRGNNSIGVPVSVSVDYSLSQTNYGTITDQDNFNLVSQQKSISTSQQMQDKDLRESQYNYKSFENNQDQNKYINQLITQDGIKTNNHYQPQNSQQQVQVHLQNMQNLSNSQLFKSPAPISIGQDLYKQQVYNRQGQSNNPLSTTTQYYQQPIQNSDQNPQIYKNNEYILPNQKSADYQNQNKYDSIYANQYNLQKNGQFHPISNMEQTKNSLNSGYQNQANHNYVNQSLQQTQNYPNNGNRMLAQSYQQPKQVDSYFKNNEISMNRTSDKTELKSNVFSFSHSQNANEMTIGKQYDNLKNQTPKQLQVQQLHSENASYTLNSRTIDDDFTSSQRSTSKMTSDILNSDYSQKY